MNETQSALWRKLESFQINEENQLFTFEMKLARENGWTASHTHRVVEEYRRFVFLCYAAGHPCSPSEAVDEAWHLHLTYTRSYWERLCGEVLPKPLHHEPSKGGKAESLKFEDWYTRTLESYRQIFGQEPPLDIWPPQGMHLARPEPQPVREDVWTISKTRTRRVFSIVSALGAVGIAAAGCDASDGAKLIVPLLVFGFFGVVFIALHLGQTNRTNQRRNDPNSGSSCGSTFVGCGGGDSGSGCDGAADSGGGCDGGSGCGGGCGGGGD